MEMSYGEVEFGMMEGTTDGYCPDCDDLTLSRVEPDARGYHCPACGGSNGMGFEQAVIEGRITVGQADDGDAEPTHHLCSKCADKARAQPDLLFRVVGKYADASALECDDCQTTEEGPRWHAYIPAEE